MKAITVAVLALLLAGCACNPAVSQGAADIEATNAIVLPQYQAYVQADAKLTDAQKADRQKLVESLQRLVAALKEAAK